MKLFFSFMLGLTVFITAGSSYALTPRKGELISAEKLHLVGRGVCAKHTDQSIALAYEDDQQDSIRFVYFDGNRNAYFVGPSYPVVGDLKKAVKGISKEVLAVKHPHRQNAGRTAFVLLGGLIGGGLLMPFTAIPFLTLLGITAIIAISPNQNFILSGLDVIGQAKNKVVHISTGINAYKDQNGWSWSSNPTKIKRSKFCDAWVAFNYPEEMDDEQVVYGNGTSVTRRGVYREECENELKQSRSKSL